MNSSEDVCQLLLTKETFFCEAFKNRSSKTAIIVLSTILSLMDIGLLYGAVWYERFGSDNRRTLINRLFTSLCWSGIVAMVIGWTDVWRYIVGPFPSPICSFQILIKDSVKTAILFFFDAVAVSRYLFIFWMKNPTALNDDFLGLFANMWIVSGSILINAAYGMTPGPRSLAFHICTGTDPTMVTNPNNPGVVIFQWMLLCSIKGFWSCLT